jgi:hypothetical protein
MWSIGLTQSGTYLPYEDSGGLPWYMSSVIASGYTSFEAAQIGVDDYLNVPDWDSIPNLGPGPALHSEWTPGAIGIVTTPPAREVISEFLALGLRNDSGYSGSGAPPLSGGGPERPAILEGSASEGQNARTGGGFRLLRPRKPPTA